MTCPKCGARIVTTDGRCVTCWWSPHDWTVGHLQRVTTRIEHARAERRRDPQMMEP